MARLNWLGTFSVCLALPSFGQQTPSSTASGQSATPAPGPPVTLTSRSHEERESRYQAQHRIILNVLVTDASGNPVTGLNEHDFALLEDGQPQKIVSVRAMNGSAAVAQVHVLLMLDALNNSARNLTRERKQVERFLRQNNGKLPYPTTIMLLSSSGVRTARPSQDGEVLIGELDKLIKDLHDFGCADEGDEANQGFSRLIFVPGVGGASGREGVRGSKAADCLNQRYLQSLSALNRLAKQQVDVPGRAILIWLGPGWPLLSNPGFSPDSQAKRRNRFDYLADLSISLRQAQVTLDAVSAPDFLPDAELRRDNSNASLNAVPTGDEADTSNMALAILAHQSGGQVLGENKDIAANIAACIADAQSYYVVSFDSAPAAKQGEYRSLLLKLNKPGLTVRTNLGYFALP
jgi:VWFA-related protein